MKRVLTHDQIVALAHSTVTHWETIPQRVRVPELAQLSDEGRATLEKHMREMIGGEEVYLAAKKFLEELEEAKS